MKSHTRNLSVLTALICCVILVPLRAKETGSRRKVTVRDLESQTILYTIHRGSYTGFGQAFARLFGLAGSKDLRPTVNVMTVHLNNPHQVAEAHWLTEIRVPVADSALSLAGSLGPMTDVKTVPGVKVAVATKPAGAASPAAIQKKLYQWIYQNGYAPIDAPMQRVISGGQTQDYTLMEVELMIPITKPENLMN